MAERLTIIDFVEKYVAKYHNNTYLWEKVGNEWTKTTYAQTKEGVYRVAAGLTVTCLDR